MENNISQFKIKQLEIINGGTEFKVSYHLSHETDALDYDTKHTVQEWNFNNCQPAYLTSLLHEHARVMNMHNEDVDVYITKVGFNEYGEEGEEQLVLKMDYEFMASGEDAAKSTTGKVLIDESYYDKSKEVKKLYFQIKENLYKFIVEGEQFPVEEKASQMEGNIVSFA